jgi:hypothetical protein
VFVSCGVVCSLWLLVGVVVLLFVFRWGCCAVFVVGCSGLVVFVFIGCLCVGCVVVVWECGCGRVCVVWCLCGGVGCCLVWVCVIGCGWFGWVVMWCVLWLCWCV